MSNELMKLHHPRVKDGIVIMGETLRAWMKRKDIKIIRWQIVTYDGEVDLFIEYQEKCIWAIIHGWWS